MRLAHLRKTRLHVIVAGTELLLGLCIYAYPTAFFAEGFVWVTKYIHLISSALVGSGALLLVLDQHRLSPAIFRLLTLVPALPVAVFATVAYIGEGWTAFIIYGLTTLAMVVASVCTRPEEPAGGVDLWQLTFGLVQVLCGLTFVVAPQLYPTPPYAPIAAYMQPLGLAGLVGGLGLLAGCFLPQKRIPELAVRAVGAVYPFFLVWSFFTSGYYTGVVVWGFWAVALATGIGNMSLRTGSQPVPTRSAGEPPTVAVVIERQLESWMWMLAFAVIGLNVATEHDNPRGSMPATIFVVAVCSYNALVFRGLRGFGSIKLRIHSHLAVLALVVAVLLPHSSPIGHAFLALLAIIPSIGTRAKGKTEGYRLMGISGAGVFLSYALFGYPHHSLLEAVLEVSLLEITSLVGLRLAADERRSASALLERQTALEEALTQARTAEHALRQSEERFRFAFEGAPIGMALVDPAGGVLQVNGALCRMLGYSAAELMELGVRGVTHPEDLRVPLPADFLSGQVSSYHREKRYIHKDGHIVWGQLSLSRVGVGTEQLTYNISHVLDITERKSYERQLMHLASYDPLTDLFNRRRFQEELEQQLMMASRSGEFGALMFIDLDQFKYVNDTLGHQAGDEFLRSVANVLRQQVRRGTDTIARLGGDEFAVILPGMDEVAARAAADGALQSLRNHSQVLAGQSVSSTASIGVALYPDHGTSAADLLARADFAMYQAKEHGRNRSYLFQPNSDAMGQAENKLRWEQRIREALENDRLVLYCQPIWDLRADRISHHELLLRMRGEGGEIISPGEFLPVAERFGLIHLIDQWVARQAIRTIADEARQGRRVVVEINLSGLAFGDADLLPLIRRELAETEIDPACLILEITETAAIADLDQARQFVLTLRELGCRFAIDDFGSGFASFAYLKHLPVDYLKIDGSFVENLVRDPVDQHLVKGMVEVARGLGKQTIAEFVGDLETMQMLREFGVDYAQGYYVGRPSPRTAESFAG